MGWRRSANLVSDDSDTTFKFEATPMTDSNDGTSLVIGVASNLKVQCSSLTRGCFGFMKLLGL